MNKKITIDSIEKLNNQYFTYENMCLTKGIGFICFFNITSREVIIDPEFELLGWCDSINSRLMHGREEQIGLLFWHKELEYIWCHYPKIDNTVEFVYKKY